MLGRPIAAVEVMAEGGFGSVETKFVLTGRSVQSQTGRPDFASGFADLVLDAQDDIACQLNKAAEAAKPLADPRVRAFGRQPAWKKVAGLFE